MSGQKIDQLQSLRFFAAASVLLGHAFMEARQQNLGTIASVIYDLPWGSGVDIFFIISGFIIFYIQPKTESGVRPALAFMLKRIIRVAPLYWIFTILMAIAVLLFSDDLRNSSLSATDFVKSILFIPYVQGDELSPRPLLAQGWTLNYEMFFYVLFSLTLLLKNSRQLVIAALLILLAGIGAVTNLDEGAGGIYFQPILIEFVAGILLAANRERLPKLSAAPALLLVGCGLLWFMFVAHGDPENGWWRLWERGIPSALIAFAVLQVKRPPAWIGSGVLPFLGDASYALYLSHTFVVNIVAIVWKKVGIESAGLFIAVAVGAAIAVSALVYRIVERPMLARLNAVVKWTGSRLAAGGRKPAAVAAAAGDW